jgi:hypothetical protein
MIENEIFQASPEQLNIGALVAREQLIGMRNGLLAAESWFIGYIIELNRKIAEENKQH